MKYLCLAYYDPEKFAALSPAEVEALVSKCPAHDARLRASGQVMMLASLGDLEQTRTIRPHHGKPVFTDGPFIETKEQVGSFFILEAQNLDEALRVAALHPAALFGEHIGWGIDVRPIENFEQ